MTLPAHPAQPGRRHDALRRYGLAIAAIVVAAAASAFMRAITGSPNPIAAWLAAIMLAGWYGGTGPALLALAGAMMLSTLRSGPLFASASSIISAFWFISFAGAAAAFGAARRRANAQLVASRDRLEEQVEERTIELRRSTNYLTEAQKLSHTGCWAMPLHSGRNYYWSEGVYRIFGLDPERTSPGLETLFSLLHPDDLERVKRTLDRAIAERHGFDARYRVIRPDGELRYIRSVGQPCHDEDGELAEFLGVVMDVTDRRRASIAVRRAREESMRARFEERLAERNRIAREMHDTLLQGFAGVSLQLAAVANRTHADPDTERDLQGVVSLAKNTLREARDAIHDLRTLSSGGDLPAAVRREAESLLRGTGLSLRFLVAGTPANLAAEQESVIVKVAHEAVINAIRHSGAAEVCVSLQWGRRAIRLVISDEGHGFALTGDPASFGGHWGLIGMREYAAQAGGRLRIRSAEGSGTVVALIVPLR